ncbi:MAG TPA: hypothetical protein VFV93_18935 [Thermomicrobiales bacterium]|nr:hypothetical protein [Thermomicrobiales bacterium]
MAVVGVLLVGTLVALPAGGQAPTSPLAPINEVRDREELPPIASSDALDALAASYLSEMLVSRCLCPTLDGDRGAERLLAEVRPALDNDAVIVEAGLIAGYDTTAERAIRTTALDPANASAVAGQWMALAGIASAVVEAGTNWLAPPPGGIGPEIELGGYTVVVIVLAGSAN